MDTTKHVQYLPQLLLIWEHSMFLSLLLPITLPPFLLLEPCLLDSSLIFVDICATVSFACISLHPQEAVVGRRSWIQPKESSTRRIHCQLIKHECLSCLLEVSLFNGYNFKRKLTTAELSLTYTNFWNGFWNYRHNLVL